MRGNIGDRPWGATLATIGLGGQTGQLTLTAADYKQYRIAFANGVVVGATSPISVDSLARIALSMKLLPAAIAKQLGKVEDIEKFSAAAALGPTQIQQLKRRVIIQRAARTFAVDVGKYVVEERVSMPVILGIEVDIRAAIYEGIRMNLSSQRLVKTMHTLGSRFVLRDDQLEEVAKFGFTELEEPVIAALREGTSIPELEATRRDIDPRMAEAVILSLALCDAVQEITMTRVPTPREPTMTRVPTPREPTMTAVPMMIRQDPVVSRVPTPRAATEGRVPTPPQQLSRVAPLPSRTATHPSVAQTSTASSGRPARLTPPQQPRAVSPQDISSRPSSPAQAQTLRGMPAVRQQATTVRVGAPASPTPPTLPRVARPLPLPPPPPPPRRTQPPPLPPRRQATDLAAGAPPTLGRDARRVALDPFAQTSTSPLHRRAAITDPFLEIQATRQRPNALSVAEVRQLISIGIELLARGVDHFTFLGLPFDASADAVREAYLEFARYLKPERLAELGIRDEGHDAHTVFAQVVIAYSVLTDPRRRAEYVAMLSTAHA